jgi:cytochrome b
MPVSRVRESAADGRVAVWDVAVRVLHWLLAGLVLFDLFHDEGDWTHRVVGYAAVVVVAARLIWAAIAPGAAALAGLRPSLRATVGYLRGRAPRTLDHDPLGVWMVWLLWLLVLLLGLTGWISRLDAFWGDQTLHDLHAWLADALLAAVAVHLVGVAAMGWHWRENLVAAMLTGRKRKPSRPK